MELKAKEVLADCQTACFELEETEENYDFIQMKLRWVTCVSLLRAVGHVLHKVDEKNHPLQARFSKLYSEKKNDAIFKDFIEIERNLVLKNYIHGLKQSHFIESRLQNILTENGDLLLTENGESFVTEQEKEVDIYFEKNSNIFNTKVPSEQIQLAINWWEKYFDELECLIMKN